MSSAANDDALKVSVALFREVPQPSGEEITPTEKSEEGDQGSCVTLSYHKWQPDDVSSENGREPFSGEVKAEEIRKTQVSIFRPGPPLPSPPQEQQDHAVSEVGSGWRQPKSGDLLQPLFPARRRLRIYPTSNRASKWVTREIAALEFLTGIRMRNEDAIRARDCGGGGGSGNGGVVSASVGGDDFPVGGFGTQESWDSRDQRPWKGVRGSSGAASEGDMSCVGEKFSLARPGELIQEEDDDSDSDGGWLDQPSDRGKSARLPGVSTRVNTPSSSTGRWMPPPARRLRGREALHVRIPPTFRHHMQSLPGHGAAVVRQWEQGLTQQERLLDGRLFFSSSKGYPVSVLSVIHYKPQEEENRRMHQKRIDELGAEVFEIQKRDWRGHSFAHLLRHQTTSSAEHPHTHHPHHSLVGGGEVVPGSSGGSSLGGGLDLITEEEVPNMGGGVVGGDGGGRGPAEAPSSSSGEAPYRYTAGFLDNPALKVGKHRHVTRGDRNTGPVVSSVLLFVKPRVLKDELNARFREEHPSLPPSLTLSKIRSIKRQALLGCHRAGMEVATVALACIYFERLCLAGWVTKPNRRLAMAACLAIAYKFNEPVLKEGSSKLPGLWAFVDQEWQVSKKRVLEAEFGVLVKLSFDLHEDPRDIFHHFVLLLKMMSSNASLYLGEDMMRFHNESLETFRGGGIDEGTGPTIPGGGGGSGAVDGGGSESPRSRNTSNVSAVGADRRGHTAAVRSQGCTFMENPGWLQRRPPGGERGTHRWLRRWRSVPGENAVRGFPSSSIQIPLDRAASGGGGAVRFLTESSQEAAAADEGDLGEDSGQPGRAIVTTAVATTSGGSGRSSAGSRCSRRSVRNSTSSFLARVSSSNRIRSEHSRRNMLDAECDRSIN